MIKILPDKTDFKGVPYVGCAVTRPSGSDRYPATIVWVSPETVSYTLPTTGEQVTIPKRIKIRECQYKRIDTNGMSEMQTYQYFEDDRVSTDGTEYSWRPKRKNYVRVGEKATRTAQTLWFGIREHYYDFSF